MAPDPCIEAWQRFLSGLEDAARQMDEYTSGLDAIERADGFRAVTRMLAANLEKLEMDGSIAEIVHDNTPNHKWFMDNPDGIYWHLVVDPEKEYIIRGNVGQACHTSIIAYNRGDHWFQTSVCSSIEGGDLVTDDEGNFEIVTSAERPDTGGWLKLEPETWLVWIRQLFEDVRNDGHGRFKISEVSPKQPPVIRPENFAKRLGVIGEMVKQIVAFTVLQARSEEKEMPNSARRWEQMRGGAVYTLPGFDYMRGSWKLGPDEALVLEGRATACRHWNIVLYSRFLNSLEHRRRPVSLTGSRVKKGEDDSYRIVIAHSDPGVPNWLDTEERPFGMFVIRWLLPEEETIVPETRVVKLIEIGE